MSWRLERLRALLHGPAQPGAWRDLCVLLDTWPPEDALGVGLDYALAHLERWPQALRVAPLSWLRALLQGREAPPPWALVRVVKLTHRHMGSRELQTLSQHPAMGSITHLSLRLHLPDERSWGAFTSSAQLSSLQHLQLREIPASQGSLRRLLEAPWAPQLLSLDLAGAKLGDEGARHLSQAEALAGLLSLDLESNQLSYRGLRAILQSPALRSLRALVIKNNPLGDHGVVELTHHDPAPPWAHLDLSRAGLTDHGLRRLAASGLLSGLRSLGLADNRVGAPGAIALARSPFLGQLEALELSRNPLRSAGLRALWESPRLHRLRRLRLVAVEAEAGTAGWLADSAPPPALRHLDLSENPEGLGDLRAWSSAPWLGQLDALELNHNPQAPQSFQALLRNPGWRKLRRLALAGAGILAQDLRRWASLEGPCALEECGLGYNDLGDAGAQALARAPSLSGLLRLDLESCGLTAAGLLALSGGWAPDGLRWLRLDRNRLGGDLEQARAALGSLAWPQLAYLSLRGCGLTAAALDQWSEAGHGRSLLHLDLGHNPLGEQGALTLAQTSGLKSLVSLHVEKCRIGDLGVEALLRAASLPALRRLRLAGNQLSGENLRLRAATPWWEP